MPRGAEPTRFGTVSGVERQHAAIKQQVLQQFVCQLGSEQVIVIFQFDEGEVNLKKPNQEGIEKNMQKPEQLGNRNIISKRIGPHLKRALQDFHASSSMYLNGISDGFRMVSSDFPMDPFF